MPLYSNVFSLYREWPGVLSVQLKRNRLPVKVQPDAVLQAEIEKAVSQTVKVQLLTGSTAARSSAVSCGCRRAPAASRGRLAGFWRMRFAQASPLAVLEHTCDVLEDTAARFPIQICIAPQA